MIAGGNHTSASRREAAKGVSSVTLSCYHSTNHTPSVSLCSTAPPPGSRECTKPPLKGLAAVRHSQNGVQLLNAKLRRLTFVSRRGQPRYAEYHSECTKANPYNPERTLYGFALDFIKPGVLTATPQPLRRQLPFQGRFG